MEFLVGVYNIDKVKLLFPPSLVVCLALYCHLLYHPSSTVAWYKDGVAI